MKKCSIFINILFFGFLLLFSCAPKHVIINSDNGVQVDPDIVYGVLPNGFQYILLENSTPGDRVNIHLNVFAGSLHETNEQQGVAHYLEHMLFNGSTNFKPGELIEYFQSIGMDFGADANAHTSFFNTVYDLSIPKTDHKHMDKAFEVIEDYAQGALLLETEIDRERGIILAEKRERDSVSYRTFKKKLEFELPDSLFNQRSPIGVDNILKKADQKLLKSFYDKWYRPDNMALIVVGDFDTEIVLPILTKRFSKLKSRGLFSNNHPFTKWKQHKGIKTFYHYEPEAGSTDISIESLSWEPFEIETAETIKKRVLKQLVSSIMQNRLSRMINLQNADFTDASVYSGSFLHNISISSIHASCDPDQWPKTLSQIEQVLRQALLYGFSNNELERVKADYISYIDQKVRQAGSQNSKKLSRRILSKINRKQMLLSAQQEKELLKPYIESVSLQDAHESIKESWLKDHRLVLVSGNADIKTKNPRDTILKLYQNSLKTKIVKYENFESKAFPYLELPSLKAKIIKRQDNVKDLGITTVDFDNNVRINLKKTDYKQNEFAFKVCFGDGKISEPVLNPGLSIISNNVIEESALANLDQDQLEEALAGKKTSLNFNIKDNYFSFSGNSDPKEAELVFQLIYHHLIDPGFKKHALELAKVRYKQEYESLMRTPSGMMQIKGESFLAKNDKRFGLPAPEIINRITLQNIENWLGPYFNNSPIEISIVGDFNTDEIINLAAKYIGSFQKREKKSTVPINSRQLGFPNGEKLELKIDTKIKIGVVHLAFLTDDFWNIAQTRRLSILSRVFSERLRLVLREELGQTYSPYVYNDPSLIFDHYGIMHVVVNVDPKNQSFVYRKIEEIINDLIFNGISKKETTLALKPVLSRLKEYKKNNYYWLNSVLSNSVNYPQKLEWSSSLIDDYSSITNKDLMGLVKKYLIIDKSAVIIIKQESVAD